jgi:protein TonB
MNARNARFLVIAAFAISLLLHVVVALNLRSHADQAPADVEVVRIERRAILIHVAKTPPPHVRPKHTPAPVESPAPKPVATGSKPAGNGGGNAPKAAATPTPTPEPTAVANACGRNDAEAGLAVAPTPPVLPVAARAEGTSGTTVVKVQLDAQGAVTGATIAETSGNASLDVIALGMARDAQYTPALHDCKPVATAYDFSVRFAAW